MAGFMAGFGSAFSQSFSQGREINAQKEQDMFRLKYADYISKRDEIQKQKKIDAQMVTGAKTMAKMNGNEELWTEYYKMKQAGLDDSAIMKWASENEAIIEPTSQTQGDNSGPADPRDTLPIKAGETVDAQMKASGMETPQPGTGLFSGMFKGRQAKVDSQIAEASGSTPEQVNSTLNNESSSGDPLAGAPDLQVKWKPKAVGNPDWTKVNSYAEAVAFKDWAELKGSPEDKEIANRLVNSQRAAATQIAIDKSIEAGTNFQEARGVLKDGKSQAYSEVDGQGNLVWKDESGNMISPEQIRPYSREMEKEISASGTEINKAVLDYNKGVTDLTQMARTANELTQLATAHPEGLDITGNVAQTVARYTRAGEGLASLITGSNVTVDKMTGKGYVNVTGNELSSLEEAEKEVQGLRGRVDDADMAATLMDIKATKLAYMYAASMGQEGRSVTQEEFKNFKLAAMGGGKPEAIKASASSFIKDKYKALKEQEMIINDQSGPITQFESKWRMPYPNKPAGNVDDFVARDPELGKVIGGYLEQPADPLAKNGDQNLPPAPQGVDPEDWKYMSEEDRALWK